MWSLLHIRLRCGCPSEQTVGILVGRQGQTTEVHILGRQQRALSSRDSDVQVAPSSVEDTSALLAEKHTVWLYRTHELFDVGGCARHPCSGISGFHDLSTTQRIDVSAFHARSYKHWHLAWHQSWPSCCRRSWRWYKSRCCCRCCRIRISCCLCSCLHRLEFSQCTTRGRAFQRNSRQVPYARSCTV